MDWWVKHQGSRPSQMGQKGKGKQDVPFVADINKGSCTYRMIASGILLEFYFEEYYNISEYR